MGLSPLKTMSEGMTNPQMPLRVTVGATPTNG
nr:MAG TPA: hypothetical protein [Bacteriophage sp.]